MTNFNVPTKNSFTALADQDDNNEQSMEEDEGEQQENTKQKLPPPLVLHGQSISHSRLTAVIKRRVNCVFNLKYTKNNVNVTINNRDESKNFIKYLITEKVESHTYSDSADKTHAFVVRGLASDVTAEELEQDLKTRYGQPVVKCYKMTFKNQQPSNPTKALFLLITKNNVTLKCITLKIQYALHTRIYFKRRRISRRVIQCHNCQAWGHATSNCHATTKCMFCAQTHKTTECTSKDALKCANCDGKHQANNTTCNVYLQKLSWLDNRRQQQPTTSNNTNRHREENYPAFKPAPIPKQNAWTQRAAEQRAEHHQQPTTQQNTHHGHQHQQHGHPPTYTGKPPTTFQQPLDSFKELTDQFDTLHSLVNINVILQAVKDLNTQLQT